MSGRSERIVFKLIILLEKKNKKNNNTFEFPHCSMNKRPVTLPYLFKNVIYKIN